MDTTEMKAWSALCDSNEANETTPFDAVAIIVESGVPGDDAAGMTERWSTQGGHRIRVTTGGLWTWDFGPDGQGYGARQANGGT